MTTNWTKISPIKLILHIFCSHNRKLYTSQTSKLYTGPKRYHTTHKGDKTAHTLLLFSDRSIATKIHKNRRTISSLRLELIAGRFNCTHLFSLSESINIFECFSISIYLCVLLNQYFSALHCSLNDQSGFKTKWPSTSFFVYGVKLGYKKADLGFCTYYWVLIDSNFVYLLQKDAKQTIN